MLTLSFLVLAALPQTASGQEFRFAREGVLGTSLELIVQAPDAAAAGKVQDAVLAEIARLATVLSHHDTTSELRRLQPTTPSAVSPELMQVLIACDQWRGLSQGAFHPGVEVLTTLWSRAEQAGALPPAAELATATQQLAGPPWRIDPESRAVTLHMPVSLDGLAKGFIIDRACQRGAAAVPGTQVDLLEIGGDLMTHGAKDRTIAITDPRQPASNGAPLFRIRVREQAVATSGGYARGFQIGGKHYSHVFDPRTGQPTGHVLGASVVAGDATTADALATILCVQTAEQGLQLVERLEDAAAVVVTADGKVHESSRWRRVVVERGAAAGNGWPAGRELELTFELQGPQTQGRGGWKRPYVAAWVEDGAGQPVRTLCLWVEKLQWLRDLQRWNRLYPDRNTMVDAVSQATRRAGAYTLRWDGKDDEQHVVPPGRYTVFLEVVREHGTYQLLRQEFAVGDAEFRADLKGNVEVKSASVRFGTKASK